MSKIVQFIAPDDETGNKIVNIFFQMREGLVQVKEVHGLRNDFGASIKLEDEYVGVILSTAYTLIAEKNIHPLHIIIFDN